MDTTTRMCTKTQVNETQQIPPSHTQSPATLVNNANTLVSRSKEKGKARNYKIGSWLLNEMQE